jgi:hypothetical protein
MNIISNFPFSETQLIAEVLIDAQKAVYVPIYGRCDDWIND